MPIYPAAPVAPVNRGVQQAVPGLPVYLLGSLNRTVAPTRMNISTVAQAGTTGTVTGTVVEGQIPVVGQLVSITGAVPSYFNVTNAKILSVSAAAVPDVGVFTITFALTNSGIGTTSSPGVAIAPQSQIGDSLTLGGTGTWYSAACSIQENVNPANGKSVRADVSFPVLPGAATITLQTADYDIDTEYVDLTTIATVTGGVLASNTSTDSAVSVTTAAVQALFCRFKVSGQAASGSATVVGKVSI